MKVIISGASGYIGNSLVQSLINDGIKPAIITRFGDNNNFKELTHIYVADITKPFAFDLKEPCDVFVHLAAANDVDSLDPEIALLTSAYGTRNALEFCKKNGIKKFIYFSTFQVIGKVTGYMDEQTPLTPVNDYGITHFFAEEYVKKYHRTANMDYIILRPTNIYGAPLRKEIDRWTLVPNCFCKEAVENQTITLLSSGKQKRDFLNLKDVINMTKLYINRFTEHCNEIIHLSSGNDFTILEIAGMVKQQYEKIFGKNCELIIKSDLPEQSNEYTIDRSLVKKANYKFDDKSSLVQEINTIFNLLKTNL